MPPDDDLPALARELGPRWRLLVHIAAYGPVRPEEQAALRLHDNSGKRAPGETKPEAGERFIVLPDFMRGDLKLHMYLYAEQKPDGLLFVGERGAPFRRTTFGRKGKKARKKVGL